MEQLPESRRRELSRRDALVRPVTLNQGTSDLRKEPEK